MFAIHFAIASSLTLKTLNERITLIDDRLALMGDRKDYAESKLWTNYLPTTTNIDSIIDPFAWLRNLAGGGDMQRDRLAIADLEVKAATLEAARAELERQREQEKVNLGEKVLQLLLSYEAATRQVELVESQVKTFQVSREVFRIRYQFGEGTTEQWLSFEERSNKLNEQLINVKTKQDEAVRELKQLVEGN
ncbi:MAG: TolC family protein [Crocosphaera sp.]